PSTGPRCWRFSTNRIVIHADRSDRPLFAYGSLRRGGGADQRLLREARWLGTATVVGRLYHDGHYPALIPDPAGTPVIGDLWDVPSHCWPALDAWEGCGATDPQPHPYRRATLHARIDASPVEAQAYVWSGPINDLHLIGCGDWLAWRGVAAPTPS
ncbi:MAG: gamma-glutamylcyclotransferase, partial [Candidatus Dadabacteria bacterium]